LAVGGLAVAASVTVLRPGTRANRFVCHQLDRAGRRVRYLGGRLQGVTYRVRGRHPDPDVADNVLADRVRSSLGGLEKRLDLPHIHVMVEEHVALLHGEVNTDEEAAELERAVAAVAGVTGVESYLHVGLIRSDSRPSEGRAVHPPSRALRSLCDAAVAAGVDEGAARPVVRGILATFADRLPAGERDHVSAHLPADVRALFSPPRRLHGAAQPRTVKQLVARIAADTGELPHDAAEGVTKAVIETLRSLIADEARDVGAVLPADLRALWQGQASQQSAPSTG
jgi:uncharacterized protein (DUF2267 family)